MSRNIFFSNQNMLYAKYESNAIMSYYKMKGLHAYAA